MRGQVNRCCVMVLLAMIVCASIAGCGSRERQIVRVSYTYAGANGEVVDETIALPVWQQLIGVEGAEKMRAESVTGRVDIYVTSTEGFDPAKLVENVNRRLDLAKSLLPATAAQEQTALLAADEEIPSFEPRTVEGLDIEIDREKVRAAGVSMADLNAVLVEKISARDAKSAPITAEQLAATKLNVSGRSLVVGDVATVRTKKVVEPVVRTHL